MFLQNSHISKKLNKYRRSDNDGFTLIELLIVVAIIAILAGILLTVIDIKGLRAKVRDNDRINDLKVIQNALEAYYADYRRYPLIMDWTGTNQGAFTSELSSYIDEVPQDPLDSQVYAYISLNNYTSYYLAARMEIASSVEGHDCWDYDPVGGSMMVPWPAKCYLVTSPRAFD